MSQHWDQVRWQDASENETGLYEAGLLKLNCDKALNYLNWQATLSFEETVQMPAEWYRTYYETPSEIRERTTAQIHKYEALAIERNLDWAE